MAAARSLLTKLPTLAPRATVLPRLRPLAAAGGATWRLPVLGSGAVEVRAFSTRPTTSSLNDPQPNWSNRPPKETILLDGCDFEHWLVVVDPPEPNLTRDEIIDSYIKKLAEVVGSEEEARTKLYSVSTKHYFAFGALVSEELSYKIKALEKVRWVLPDSYLDVRNKDYGGEPFIDGQAVPYDPKYHEEWVRNNSRANERNRRNDRPRNNDRSRNFERRNGNMQNFQGGPPQPNQDFQNPMPPRDGPPMPNNAPPNPTPFRNMPPVHSGNPQTGPPNFNANNAGPPNFNANNAGPPNFNANNASLPRGGYPNQMPNSQNSYAPSGPPPPPNFNANNAGPPSGPPPPNFNANNAGPPRGGYPNQMPNSQNSYAPSGPPPPPNFNANNAGPPSGPPPLSYNQGYQGGNPAGPVSQGYNQGYQGNPQGYNGGGPNYQQGRAPSYQQGGYPQQGGGNPGYNAGGQGGGEGPNYHQQPGQGGVPYQGNVPGRD